MAGQALGERARDGTWTAEPHEFDVLWRQTDGVDLVLLSLRGETKPSPALKTVFAACEEIGAIPETVAAGFPEAWRTATGALRDYNLSGSLRIAERDGPYAWTVSMADKPDRPQGWQGMSGSVVCHVSPDDELHVFGVVQEVPADFTSGMLQVARLSAAFGNDAFRNALRIALGSEPRIVPWTGRGRPIVQRPARSTIPSLRNRPFVGREDILADMRACLGDPRNDAVIVLHGPAGVGKSEVALEYARRQQPMYPGGTFLLDGGERDVVIGLARLGTTVLGLDVPPGMPLEDQAERTRLALGVAPSLLIYDAVQSADAVEPWLPPTGMPCHVVMTTTLDRWDFGWQAIKVRPLSSETSLELIARIAGHDVATRYGAQLVAVADGLPVQIVPASATLAYQARRRHPGAASPALLTREAQTSFLGVYQQLDQPAQLLLHAAARLAPQHIPRAELQRHLTEAAGWSQDEFLHRLDACLDLHVLQDGDELRMHQLFATFVRDTAVPAELAASLTPVVRVQALRMVAIATELAQHPNRADLAAIFLALVPALGRWDVQDVEVSIADGETIGNALIGIGAFENARPWYERAVAAAGKGDVHGRVDHESLGASLHAVGDCLSSTGQFEAARPWYERAVAAAGKGDVHGRVDHASLGRSLHQVGVCLSSTGQFEAARPWYERAVAAAGKGDVHGRVDHASLGRSLHQVGYCLSSTGQFEAARPWYERAVAAAGKGDVHGRVDHASLGRSLHQVGVCLSSTGQFEAARPWYERAVAEKGKGDVHGRVDHESLGRSLHEVGYCLSSTGQFEAARPWYERAVAEKGKGDVHGRVDHASLGASLHAVGDCLSSTGQFEAARPWYERAVAAAGKGDVHGRVDHASLGASLHAVGDCLSSTGQFEAARPWYERAVAAAGKGDVHGRVDHASLGASLHAVGVCLSSTGQFEAARPWYERAVAAAGKGDVHGRVDHASLGASLHAVGVCLSSTGQFEAARPWYERAATEAGKGDVHGRVDHESLGASLHEVGYCLSSTGQFEAARPWYERAVAAAGKGDVHGRVDHESLGASLHAVGYCLSSTGQFEAARPWYERAATEAGKGDVHGRVDHESLGASLHEVGYCLSSTGQFEAARPWYERAVAEKGKGDVHGRVDHESLGRSLHQVGVCLSNTGQFEAARPWYERAVAEKGKGDVHGRVNAASLAMSLRAGAICLRELEHHDEADAWEARASEVDKP